MTRLFVLAFVLVVGLPGLVAAQDAHVAVIVGLGGEPEHAETFRRWAGSLVDHAGGRLGIPPERILYLAEDPQLDPKRATAKATKAEVEKRLSALGAAAKKDDVVFIVLIGHGTSDGKVAKFNLSGPDMTAADFGAILKGFGTRNVVFVNSSSASGPFIEALAAPGRVIVTATRNAAEQFATLFGGYFIDALASDAADADKNRRVSVLEAFNAAKADVARVYQQRGVMLTERAMLEDGGDGEGSLDPAVNGKDGSIAAMLSLGAAAEDVKLPADPALRKLYEERRELERRAEALKLMKASMPPAQYASELEKVLTDLAVKSQEIRAIEGKGK
ncbi:MAG TPA: C13 family peptidase [Vicinamibacterales bacterium]|nr:C13 family peptidase [Vicinamibacterales bacterium]